MSTPPAPDAMTQLLLSPSLHVPLSIVKGIRNGLVYGTKVRFPHALVMILLFRQSTPLRQKLRMVLSATRTHARNLASFVAVYKTTGYAVRGALGGKERSWESFVAGLAGGYLVFGRGAASSVNQQIVIYVFARVVLGLAKLWAEQGKIPGVRGKHTNGVDGKDTWPLFAAVSWAMVMWLFRWHPEVLQPSLRSSMTYLYTNSEKWTGWRDFLWHNS